MARALLLAVAVTACPLAASPAAAAGVNLAVGMPLEFGEGVCTVGFFAYNRRDDHLAVTAGHCTDYIKQPVRSERGGRIGEVIAYQKDADDGAGGLIGSRGYTLILLSRRLSLQPYFTRIGTVDEGDAVRKYGERTGKTQGHITRVRYNNRRPDPPLIWSDMVQLPGDSGGPWVTGSATLVGIGSSGNQARLGGGAGSQAQPINAVIDMIRTNTGTWGAGFKVWIE